MASHRVMPRPTTVVACSARLGIAVRPASSISNRTGLQFLPCAESYLVTNSSMIEPHSSRTSGDKPSRCCSFHRRKILMGLGAYSKSRGIKSEHVRDLTTVSVNKGIMRDVKVLQLDKRKRSVKSASSEGTSSNWLASFGSSA